MKSWLNKILGREPMLVRRKVQVDLRYHSYRFSMDDFKQPTKDITPPIDELASAENQVSEIASSVDSSIK